MQTWLWATVDRIESGENGQEFAVLVFDEGPELVVPRSLLPWLRRGMVLRVTFERDEAVERARRAEIAQRQQELFGREGA
ncbi:DUF3006 domain-containing protein [Thermomicrobium sp. CFH 73360]|uniref:DUF3006 domain-containing protein n=1 Tax=Thermomicrobium sp. CFH 73360 TaxID=2951987 RepID=UPI00207672F4|nr:DUF3006 domain-containing protein [Thermomicrobium sp. CFH 73360]MCM8745388.1 DUF3006 domain-containing protein [Thermomicrobium sp. CFH 73360]